MATESTLQKRDGTSATAGRRTRGRGKSRTGTAPNRRDEIIETAAKLFAANGFDATSVRQIAKEVNILSGSLYHHFATKEEILHEILRKAVVPLMEKSIALAAADCDAEIRLVALLILRLRELTNDFETFSIIYNNRNYFRGKKEFQYVEQAKTGGFEAMEKVLKEGVESGSFREDLDTFLTIGTIYHMLSGAADGLISGSFVQLSKKPRKYDLEAVVEYHVNFVLSAVRSSRRKSKSIPWSAAEALLEAVDS